MCKLISSNQKQTRPLQLIHSFHVMAAKVPAVNDWRVIAHSSYGGSLLSEGDCWFCKYLLYSYRRKLNSMRWFSQRCSPMPHFGGRCAPRGLWPPHSNSAEIFVQCKFHHPMFTRSEVTVLTNKQTNKQMNRCRWKHPALRRLVKTCYCVLALLLERSTKRQN